MEVNKRISTMDALLFVMNLEVMLLQLRILEGSVERSTKQWILRNKSETQQREKLCRERQIVKDVVRRTLVEVAEDGEFHTLERAIKILEDSSTSLAALRSSYEHLKNSLEAISCELLTKKHLWNLELWNYDQKAACLRDKIKDCVLNTNTQLCYAEKWLCARAESLDLRIQFDLTSTPGPKPDHERRVHHKLLRAYELQIKEREQSLEYWKIRYDNDTAKLHQQLTKQCEMLRVTVARRTELQQLYDLHQGEMRAWLTFKKERAARRAREERLRVAAARIQSWWRGVMVRRALGAFRYLKNAKKTTTKTKKSNAGIISLSTNP